MELTYQQSSILQLLENHLKQLDNEDQNLDRKAQQNISVSTIVIALVTALNLTQPVPSDERWIFLSLVFLVYVAIFVLSYMILSPKDWWQPFAPSWEEIDRVFAKSDQDFYDWQVTLYLGAIDNNRKITVWKVRRIQTTNLLIAADLLLIFLAAAS